MHDSCWSTWIIYADPILSWAVLDAFISHITPIGYLLMTVKATRGWIAWAMIQLAGVIQSLWYELASCSHRRTAHTKRDPAFPYAARFCGLASTVRNQCAQQRPLAFVRGHEKQQNSWSISIWHHLSSTLSLLQSTKNRLNHQNSRTPWNR